MIRLFVLNFAGACIVAWAAWLGYVQRILAADAAHIGYIIIAVFLAGVASTFWRAHRLGKEDEARSDHLSDIVSALFILGIIGNAIGFLIAFSGIDASALESSEGIRRAGAQLLSGAGTAFGSTLLGLSLALWTMINVRMLATARALRGVL